MAAPPNRKIRFRTSVLPLDETAFSAVAGILEECDLSRATYNKNTLVTSIGKLGGNGVCTDLAANQWGDGWSSFLSDLDSDIWEESEEAWELSGAWEPTSYDADDGIKLTTSGVGLVSDTNNLAFLYIKNLGATNKALISLNSDGNYYIQIPAGGSVQLRGDGSTIQCNHVYAKSDSNTTNIEYLIAKT